MVPSCSNFTDTWSWSQPVVSGTSPPPLAAHGCAVVGRRVFLFGGLTIGGASDVLYCLDTGETLLDPKMGLY